MLKGFKDLDGCWIPLEDVSSKGNWGWMKPFASSMAKHELKQREHKGDFRVSGLGPTRIHCLEKQHGYYVDLTSRMALWKGSMLHDALSMETNGDLVETPVAAKIHNAVLTGTPDRFNPETGHLVDYKFTKCYAFNRLEKEVEESKTVDQHHEYVRQLWTYRYLLEQNKYHVKKMSLIIDMADWSATSWKSQPEKCLMELEIPFPDDAKFEKWLFDKIEEFILYKTEHNRALPMCSDDDRWKNSKGNFLRCEHYCDVQPFCKAIAEEDKFEWEKGYMACVNVLSPPSKGAVSEILSQKFSIDDPAELQFRHQWIEIFQHFKNRRIEK